MFLLPGWNQGTGMKHVTLGWVMWLTGGEKTQSTPKSSVPTFQPPAQAVNEAQNNALQSRMQELQRGQEAPITQQNKFFGSLPPSTETSAPAQVSGPAPEPAQPDRVQAEKKRRALPLPKTLYRLS
jgi:hypothetical protein